MIETRELLLASTSHSRRQILDALGLPYRAEAPDFTETHPTGVSFEDLAETLALGKARSVSRRFEEAIVVGADQLLAFEGKLLHKPKDRNEARSQLVALNGGTHTLITGVAIVCEKTHGLRVSHELARLTMRHLDAGEIDRYVATGEWQGCVGSYRVEGQGLKLFERIEGDMFCIRGLPTVRMCTALRELGFPLFA